MYVSSLLLNDTSQYKSACVGLGSPVAVAFLVLIIMVNQEVPLMLPDAKSNGAGDWCG